MVDQATMATDTFSELFTLLNNNVTSATDTQGNNVNLRSSDNGNQWYGEYPETSLITNSSEYPIAVISTPNFDETPEGFRYDRSEITVEITVFGARAEHPPLFIEKAAEAIRNNLGDLYGAKLNNFSLGQTRTETTVGRGGDRGDLKIHEMTLPVSFDFGVTEFGGL